MFQETVETETGPQQRFAFVRENPNDHPTHLTSHRSNMIDDHESGASSLTTPGIAQGFQWFVAQSALT